MTPRRWLFVLLSFGGAIAASIWVVATSWPATRMNVSLTWTAHLLALAAVVAEVVTRSMKIRLSAAAYRVPLHFGTAVRVSLGGDFGASITPSRSGAEPARFFVLVGAGTPVTGILLILFTELLLEAMSIAVVALGLALFVHGSTRVMHGLAGVVAGYAAFVVGIAVVGMMLARRNAEGPPPRWASAIGLRGGIWLRVQNALRNLRDGVAAVRNARLGMMTLAFLTSVLHVCFRLTVLPVLVWSYAPDVPLAPLVLWPMALIFGGVVAPAPGGGGLIEVAYRAALGHTIPAPIFGASLIWWRFYTFYIYIPLGALAAGRTAMRAIRGRSGGADAGPDDAAAPADAPSAA